MDNLTQTTQSLHPPLEEPVVVLHAAPGVAVKVDGGGGVDHDVLGDVVAVVGRRPLGHSVTLEEVVV